jgi:8-oxo-dGTP pyrophosphatase MutT (NUDIX family)
MKISCGIIIRFNNKLLLCHPTNASKTNRYSFPKGTINDDESLIECAIRECFEEVGIKINETSISSHYVVNYTKKNTAKIVKQVNLFLVDIESLAEIRLQTEVIPKKQLQLDEIDWAGFLNKKECDLKAFWRFKPIINELLD